MNYNGFFKREITIVLISVIVIFLIIIGTSYALFMKVESSEVNVIESGTLSLTLAGGEKVIDDIIPLSNEDGEEQSGYSFTISNGGSLDSKYSITLENIAEDPLPNEYIMYKLDDEEAKLLTGSGVVTLKSNLKMVAGASENHVIKIWIQEDAPTSIIGKGIKLMLSVNSEATTIPGVETLINKSNPESITTYAGGNKGEMFKFIHAATTQVKDAAQLIDYRYIGNVPNNYIKFNCDDSGNCEDWRIIGVFRDVDGNQNIKIIKDVALEKFSFDYKQNGVGSSINDYGSNDWSDAQLMYALNKDFVSSGKYIKTGYTKTADGIIKDANGKIIYQLGYKPAAITTSATAYTSTETFPWSLTTVAKSQIDEVTYFLGGNTNPYTNPYGTGENIYSCERGTTVYNGRPTSWIGYIGLMYISDYIETFALGVENQCFSNAYSCNSESNGTPSNSWLYKSGKTQWAMSSGADGPYHGFRIQPDGAVTGLSSFGQALISPVAYLKSNIKLRGSGTTTDPYIIVD